MVEDNLRASSRRRETAIKKFDPKVFQLGYVALETPEFEKTKDHYLETIGMTETAKGDDGSAYLSMGYNNHDIVLKKAQGKALLHLGYQLKPMWELNDFAKEVTDCGLTAKLKSDCQPGISELIEVEGPGGNMFQFYSKMTAPAPGFKRTGIVPLRLGHVAVISQEADELMEFYDNFLGFWRTDEILSLSHFYTCNRDHHVVNIINAPLSKVHHIAFQLKDNAHHSVASDALRERGVKTLWGPSRHTAGHNIASYHYTPDQVMIELYTEMDVFIPELGICEPRPWHEQFPMQPKIWTEVAAWSTAFEFNLAQA
jgi:catechol 2,3-dioxygenase-like lactoylglutathione lyase family enzyme